MALVSSKLYYCNSLFHSMSENDIARLQRVQNCLARVVTKASRVSRSVPILKQLHWPLLKCRIHFKISTITFRIPKDSQPAYRPLGVRRCKTATLWQFSTFWLQGGDIWLTYLLGRNAQNIYAPQIKIDYTEHYRPMLLPN